MHRTGVRELRRGGPGAGLQADQPEQTRQRRHPRGHVQADLETRHVVGARDTCQMGLTFVGVERVVEIRNVTMPRQQLFLFLTKKYKEALRRCCTVAVYRNFEKNSKCRNS